MTLRYTLSFSYRSFSSALFSRKTDKILRYFEQKYGYETNLEVIGLSQMIKKSNTCRVVDMKVCEEMPRLSIDNMLFLMNQWARISCASLKSAVFYHAFLNFARKNDWKSAEWKHLVQAIHFIGYLNGEKDSKKIILSLLYCVNNAPSLTNAGFKDVCIISEAAYRTSAVVNFPCIQKRIFSIIEHNLFEISRDDVWLVMIIKTLTLSKMYDEELLKLMSSQWLAMINFDKTPFTTISYIMSLFAHAGLKIDRLFTILLSSARSQLAKETFRPRMKDVSILLWSLSTFVIYCEKDFLLNEIIPFLLEEITAYNLDGDFKFIIQCCISIWMLGHLPLELWNKVLTVEVLQGLKDKDKNYRDLSRFALMLEILKAENQKILTHEQLDIERKLKDIQLLKPDIKKETEKRPQLLRAFIWLTEMTTEQTKIEYLLPGLYVAGITFQWGKQLVHADVLDSTNSLIDTKQPTGRILAKNRLLGLQHIKLRHILISEDDIGNKKVLDSLLQLP